MYRVLFVCHGNICRSTMAQSVFAHLVEKRGMADRFVIDSAATSTEEIGSPPHQGTVRKLQEKGIGVVPHRAVQIRARDYDRWDYIIGMDTWNQRNLERILMGDPAGKVCKLLAFAGRVDDIADPWYTGDFEATYRDVRMGCEALLKHLLGE